MKLLVEAPINQLSLGNVSVNFLIEMFKKNVDVALIPIGDTNISVYDKLPKGFVEWLVEASNKADDFVADKVTSLKLFHISHSRERSSPKQILYTFYECSNPTAREVAYIKSQERAIFSSSYASSKFFEAGCQNARYVPLGFDPTFHVIDEKVMEGVVHFGLMGKFEKRKRTADIIKAWAKAYGNDNKYQLSLCVSNPFLKQDIRDIINSVLGGVRYTNINVLPFLADNSLVNQFMNSIDIDLTGLSGGEGWNLPAFNATALGKWSVVLNATSHRDWANASNSILVEPDSTFSCDDGVFFKEGANFNQGVFYNCSEDAMIDGMNRAVELVEKGVNNDDGLLLQEEFSYSKTVDKILEII